MSSSDSSMLSTTSDPLAKASASTTEVLEATFSTNAYSPRSALGCVEAENQLRRPMPTVRGDYHLQYLMCGLVYTSGSPAFVWTFLVDNKARWRIAGVLAGADWKGNPVPVSSTWRLKPLSIEECLKFLTMCFRRCRELQARCMSAAQQSRCPVPRHKARANLELMERREIRSTN